MARRRPIRRGGSTAAKRGRDLAEARQVKRRDEYERWLAELLRDSMRDMVTGDLLQAVLAGQIGRAREALRRPKTSRALRVVQRVQRNAWDVGWEEGQDALHDAFSDPLTECFSDTRAEVLAARRARKARYKALGPERREARQQARAIMRSFVAHTRDELGQRMSRARAGADPENALKDARDFLADLREGRLTGDAKAFLRGVEDRTRGVSSTPLLEVDWTVARRAEVTRWQQVDEVVMLVEAGVVEDDATTPACQFQDGESMIHGDKRLLGSFNFGQHFG